MARMAFMGQTDLSMTNGVYTTTPDLIFKERLKYQNYLDNLNDKFTTLITTPYFYRKMKGYEGLCNK